MGGAQPRFPLSLFIPSHFWQRFRRRGGGEKQLFILFFFFSSLPPPLSMCHNLEMFLWGTAWMAAASLPRGLPGTELAPKPTWLHPKTWGGRGAARGAPRAFPSAPTASKSRCPSPGEHRHRRAASRSLLGLGFLLAAPLGPAGEGNWAGAEPPEPRRGLAASAGGGSGPEMPRAG